MNKVLAWALKFTKAGKVVDPAREFLSGKKSYLAGIALIVPALVMIINGFVDGGVAYLLQITHQPEWTELLNGIAVITVRAAIAKADDPKKDPNN